MVASAIVCQFLESAADASCAILTAAIPIPPVMSAPMIANILRMLQHSNKSNYICIMAFEHK
jgi:hypothetical protein